jgi:hypothetical protein
MALGLSFQVVSLAELVDSGPFSIEESGAEAPTVDFEGLGSLFDPSLSRSVQIFVLPYETTHPPNITYSPYIYPQNE